MSDWLHDSSERVALAFDGDVVRYGELARSVDAARLPAGDGVVGCPVGLDPVTLLTTVLACLDRGRPVLVGGTADQAEQVAGGLPAGTGLALLTSGSSSADGRPRVVARTSASWLASAAPLAELAELRPADRVAMTGPLHVSMHLYAALHALWLGASVGDSLTGATAMHATPTRLARVLDDAACPPKAVVAGAAMSGTLRSGAAARGIRLTEYYGAAELSFVLAGCDDGLRPFPGVEVGLRQAASGRELWARSPYLALGVVGGGMLRRDAEGFATVGDLAETTASGAYRVLGRGDAAITTAGATVLAEEVEAHIAALPGVAGAAVLGEPHELLGERVVAVVELAPGTALEQVVTEAHAALSPVELPRRWFVADALPRTGSGKVARGVLRDGLASGALGPAFPAAFERSSA
ncbi:MAG TPA: fatty acid--CoA ligase family protein [Solirubrobacteraceae bacterium]|nr:fatty acid--CoA ligase family protein [Solirubrobacteraceae bacterium]